jgi:ribosome-associated protein
LTPEDLAREIVEYADDRKAIDIVQLDLRGMIGYTDYFVICTGRTERQTKAIHDAIYEGLKSAHRRLPERVEGLPGGRWILMDYLDVVVHVFVPDTREYYRLEQLWGEAPAHAVGAGPATSPPVASAPPLSCGS